MNIEPGFYIQQNIEPDEKMIKLLSLEEQKLGIANSVKYYLILSVDDKQIDALFFNGTPPINSQMLAYDDVSNLYDIKEIPLKEVKLTPIYRYHKINNLEGMYQVAIKHEWHGKEFNRLLTQNYWNGHEWIDNSEFWDSMEDMVRDDKCSKN